MYILWWLNVVVNIVLINFKRVYTEGRWAEIAQLV
jgi:hypothetical protein